MTTGVVLMSYGSPRCLDEVGPYLREIRGGREPGPDAIEELTGRYRSIGGRSPLLDITRRQATKLSDLLGSDFVVTVGMKHWHPFIAEAVETFDGTEIGTIVGLALAPHYARMSIGGYEQRLREAVATARPDAAMKMVHRWYDEPSFVAFAAGALRAALGDWDPRSPDVRVIFTAHSLPERILTEGDPYRDELLESAQIVADLLGVRSHEFAFQSASATGEPWLGPDVLDRLEAARTDGVRRVVVHPIGFTCDHLEVLYDIDVECAARAAELGLELRRASPGNDNPRFIRALAAVVRRAAS